MTPEQYLKRYHPDANATVVDNTIVIEYNSTMEGHLQVSTYNLMTANSLKKYKYIIDRTL